MNGDISDEIKGKAERLRSGERLAILEVERVHHHQRCRIGDGMRSGC